MVGCLEFCKMTEGRHCQVILLDGRQLEILVKPKLYAGELLDMVASHFSIKEKEYFGLAFLDDTGHHNWLHLERRVLEHDLPKKATQDYFVLYFLVKYFVESITQLRDAATVEVFYLQAQLLVFKGIVEVDSDTSFHLAALVLQATHGDYVDDKTTREQLKKLPVLPTSVLKQHPSLPVCEEQVIGHYCKMSGQSRGVAIVNYMTVVESLPTYGVHFYEVKDKRCMPWWLGISFRGISQYDYSDRKTPRKIFLWKQLENLYFKDRKFSMEVHDVRRIPISRRAFGPGNVVVHVWFTASPSLTKSMWSMAVSQHQFYLDRKHGKTSPPAAHNLGDIAMELSKSAQSLSSSSSPANLSRSASSHSLPALKLDSELNEQTKAAYIEITNALKTRKDILEVALCRKLEELQFLCLKEGELIGEPLCDIPNETGQSKEEGFVLEDLLDTNLDHDNKDHIAKLELDYEIQSRITKAAQTLASDSRASKNICRQRKLSYQQSQTRLSQIEEQLAALKKWNITPLNSNICDSTNEESKQRSISQNIDDPLLNEPGINLPDVNQDQSMTEAENTDNSAIKLSPSPASSASLLSPSQHQTAAGSNSAPPSPTKYRNMHHGVRISSTQPSTPCSGNSSRTWSQTLSGQGYTPNSVYQTRYRNQQYPILSTYSAGSDSSSGSALSLKSPYQNRFESTLNIEGSNLYSVPTQRTSQAFDSQDDILAIFPPIPQEFTMMSRHNSLDSSRRHSYQKYVSWLNSSPERKETKITTSVPPPYNGSMGYSLPVDERMRLHNHHHSPSQYCHHHIHSSQHCIHHQPHHHHHHHHLEQEFAYSALDIQRQILSPIPHHHQQYHHMCQREHITSLSPNYHIETLHGSSSSFLHPTTTVSADESPTIQRDPYNLNSATLSPRSKVKVWAETSLDTHVLAHRKKAQMPEHCDLANIVSSAACSLPQTTNVSMADRQLVEKHVPTSLCSHSFSHLLHLDTKVVSPGHFQPYWEETKPYEISDFYKYSVKHRKQAQQQNDQKTDKVAKHSSDSKQDHILNQTEIPKSSLSDERISFDEAASTADGFHEEMLAWYQDHENVNKATLV